MKTHYNETKTSKIKNQSDIKKQKIKLTEQNP
jgi:hypothetical protein